MRRFQGDESESSIAAPGDESESSTAGATAKAWTPPPPPGACGDGRISLGVTREQLAMLPKSIVRQIASFALMRSQGREWLEDEAYTPVPTPAISAAPETPRDPSITKRDATEYPFPEGRSTSDNVNHIRTTGSRVPRHRGSVSTGRARDRGLPRLDL